MNSTLPPIYIWVIWIVKCNEKSRNPRWQKLLLKIKIKDLHRNHNKNIYLKIMLLNHMRNKRDIHADKVHTVTSVFIFSPVLCCSLRWVTSFTHLQSFSNTDFIQQKHYLSEVKVGLNTSWTYCLTHALIYYGLVNSLTNFEKKKTIHKCITTLFLLIFHFFIKTFYKNTYLVFIVLNTKISLCFLFYKYVVIHGYISYSQN